ncbi:alpha/beta hydrolase [Nonomuraea sp. NPDC046570]|uniref:alpha/beta hydrolase n=1 Tax=Nonomuraea sp. NPDC046570 TaxID=3155255 RepID=UPI0033E28642
MALDPLLVPLLRAHRPGRSYAAYVEREPELTEIRDETVPPDGFGVRIYRDARSRLPGALVYYHGGGWTSGTLDGPDNRCRAIAAGAGVVVISVDYRLAPGFPFPIPLEDAYRALTWAVEEADRLGFDPGRIGVAGESAGGNLAAAVALLARERGGPRLRLQVLEIPALDLTLSSPSIAAYGEGYVLSAAALADHVRDYLGGRDPAEPLASPLLAGDLSGLPPALVAVAECDPLADDGDRYARRLTEAGVPVTFRRFAGQVHGSQSLTALLPTAREWRETVVAAVRDHLTGERPDGG